jgi:hypothetical protein
MNETTIAAFYDEFEKIAAQWVRSPAKIPEVRWEALGLSRMAKNRYLNAHHKKLQREAREQFRAGYGWGYPEGEAKKVRAIIKREGGYQPVQ